METKVCSCGLGPQRCGHPAVGSRDATSRMNTTQTAREQGGGSGEGGTAPEPPAPAAASPLASEAPTRNSLPFR